MAVAVVRKTLAAFDGDEMKRGKLIRSMRLHHIDVDGCFRQAMAQSLKITAPQYAVFTLVKHGFVFSGFSDEVEPEDRQLIRGLEWLMAGSNQLKGELVKSGCEVYKRFLLTGRLSAAKILYSDVSSKKIFPPSDYTRLASEMELDELAGDIDEEEKVAAAMYFVMESLIGAMIALDEWRTASGVMFCV